MSIIKDLENKIYENKIITKNQSIYLDNLNEEDLQKLFHGANRIREKFMGNKVDLCSIMNAKSGRCSEDCKFCAQSIRYNTNVKVHGIVDEDEAIKLALENEKEGINKFSLVTSGRGLLGKEFYEIVRIYKTLREKVNIDLCASLGILTYEQLVSLKEVGVSTYHHNLETNRNYYKKICTTHSYDERINTIKNAQRAGLKVCCGGIIGLGESMEDRIDLAFELNSLNIKSIPINVLNPIKGTPLQEAKPLTQKEILKTMAIFRFINPKANIRLAGGRNLIENFGERCFKVGASATISGNYLTTSGNKIKDDIKMINNLGLEVKSND
ncbi:biotin synthase BioB [Clostridium niameyense]|uniref:Biotin synthase n=1 Tax=Clostridium niameyense TaxID=1622073 RepID=A0A6M0R9T6_9CLOT|nr:biotin synthase BioB [Clostridium niameyense]NEZ46440.1 biotin synthase BioB [Clostridium niameyense]